MSNVPVRSQDGNPLPSDQMAQSTSRQGNEEKRETALKQIIDQSVGFQMAEMKGVITELTATVGKLSVVVQQTQMDQKKLMENSIPKTAGSANDANHRMGTSDMQKESDRLSRCSSASGRELYRHDNKPRVDKWGLEFDGDQNKLAVEDFEFRVESLQRRYGVAWGVVLDNFHLLVKDPAEKWYWLFMQTNYVTEWNTLKQALLKQYQATTSSFELLRDMVERRQLPGESIDAFFFAMMQLRSRSTMSMPESEMIKMIKKNLKEPIGRIVYPMTVSSVEELKTCCLDAEKTFLRRDVRPNMMPNSRFNRQVNELYGDYIENYCEIESNAGEVAELRSTNISNNNGVNDKPSIKDFKLLELSSRWTRFHGLPFG